MANKAKTKHPKVNKKVKVSCTCGNTFYTSSTLDDISVDICSNCHPFYTGVQKFVDTQGRVDKFKKKQQRAQKMQEEEEKREKKKKEEEGSSQQPQTLKDMLKNARGE